MNYAHETKYVPRVAVGAYLLAGWTIDYESTGDLYVRIRRLKKTDNNPVARRLGDL